LRGAGITMSQLAVFGFLLLIGVLFGRSLFAANSGLGTRIVSVLMLAVTFALAASFVRYEIFATDAERAEWAAQKRMADNAASVAVSAAEQEQARQRAEAERAASQPKPLAERVFRSVEELQVDHADGRLAVIIRRDADWGGSFLKASVLSDVSRYVPAVLAANPEIDHIEFLLRSQLIDVRGQESIDQMLRLRMTRQNAATINWEKFSPDDLPRVADFYWEHRLLKK
jgi:hypothetical protein